MKRNLFLIALVAIAAIIFASCKNNKQTEPEINPVWGTTPVSNAFYTDEQGSQNFPLDKFHQLGESGDTAAQRQLVNEYRRVLTANVVRHYPQITDENNVHFVLGSGFAKDVKSGDGKTYSGSFKNELIIIINDPNIKDTVFLACGNGMLSPLDFSDRHDFGHAEQWRFTILPGEGLAHHLPELQAWAEVANNLSIPIKDKNGKVVSQTTYLNYLGRYESYLFPYDVVDILNGKVYDENGYEVNFERRLEAAEQHKAAKQAKEKAKKKSTKKRR